MVFPRTCFAAALLTEWPANDYDIVRGYWRGILADGDFESLWRRALHDGVMARTVSAAGGPSPVALPPPPPPIQTPAQDLNCLSGPTRTSMTGDSPTMPGCRNCPSR